MSGSDSDDEKREERVSRRELAQATKAVKEMVDAGYVEVLRSCSGEEAGIVGNGYRRVPPVTPLSPEAVVSERKQRRKYLKQQA